MGEIKLSGKGLGNLVLDATAFSCDFADKHTESENAKKVLKLISYPISLIKSAYYQLKYEK